MRQLARSPVCDNPMNWSPLRQGFKAMGRGFAERAWDGGEEVESPSAYYVVAGDETGAVHTFWDRAVEAAGGSSHQHRVQKFRFFREAEDYVTTFDWSQLPHRLVGATAEAGRVVVFDTETTGLSFENDQLVGLALAVYDDGIRKGEVQHYRFRPTVSQMSEEAEEMHGISIEDLQDEQPFSYYADTIRQTLEEANSWMGYNVRFDINMVQAEFRRASVEPLTLVGVSIIDPYQIWRKKARRRLQDAHQVFLRTPMQNAHNATADVVATAHVFNAMVTEFDLSDNDASAIDSMWRGAQVDLDGKFVWDSDGEVVFNFGRNRGSSALDPDCEGYLEWILNPRQGFPPGATRIARLALSVQNEEVEREAFNESVRRQFGGPPQPHDDA